MSTQRIAVRIPRNQTDPDAQAFITAAGITDTTQQSAINTLVLDLKGYNIWSKFSAVYPFVGGTATTHKFNLKNPLDTNAAFRLFFNGGGTHSSNGYQTNGLNAFAETYYNPSVNLTSASSNHISIYSRTNNQGGIDMGGGVGSVLVDLELKYSTTSFNWNMAANFSHTNSNSQGHYINTRTASNAFKLLKNGTTVLGSSTGASGVTKPNITYHIGKRNYDPLWTNRQYCFASIGDGLTDTEAANFYTAVQAFQTTLGRSIGTQTVSDADAQAFVTAAGITDQVQANAVNNLVIGMKADGLWTKMKAVYPFVGGTASTHKWNLKNPLDTDAAFRLDFPGGLVHSSTGVKGNGINGYFNTWINPSTLFSSASGGSMFTYIRNNTQTGVDLGAFQAGVVYRMQLTTRTTSNEIFGAALSNNFIYETNLDSRGFWGVTRPPSSSTYHLIKNNTSSSSTDSYFEPNAYLKGLALGIDFSNQILYSDHELAFVCVADGLTTTEAQTLRTINLTFQTALGRQV
jgi:hypothetical protein